MLRDATCAISCGAQSHEFLLLFQRHITFVRGFRIARGFALCKMLSRNEVATSRSYFPEDSSKSRMFDVYGKPGSNMYALSRPAPLRELTLHQIAGHRSTMRPRGIAFISVGYLLATEDAPRGVRAQHSGVRVARYAQPATCSRRCCGYCRTARAHGEEQFS